MLVVDASVALAAAAAGPDGFDTFIDPDLTAPPLLWSETRSVLHEAARRGELPAAAARLLRRRIERSPIFEQAPPGLGEAAWDVAERLRAGRTYAAEYVALARLLGCPLVTLDADLQRRARRLCRIVGPSEVTR